MNYIDTDFSVDSSSCLSFYNTGKQTKTDRQTKLQTDTQLKIPAMMLRLLPSWAVNVKCCEIDK